MHSSTIRAGRHIDVPESKAAKGTCSSFIEHYYKNKTNDLILNLTPESVTQHSRIE